MDGKSGKVRVSIHAGHRWNERKPHNCPVELEEAWRESEQLKHTGIARCGDSTVDDSFVYNHADEWAVVFLIGDKIETKTFGTRSERSLMTVMRVRDYNHGPTRAYLHAHGPHDR
jgi:hypothetical protein